MNNTDITHYSQLELETAYLSPYQTLYSHDEIEFERLRRQYKEQQDIELVLRSIN